MGLAVVVGLLLEEDEEGLESFLSALESLNTVLLGNSLPAHVEPASGPPFQSRAPLDSLPYSFIHHLRRAYLRRRADPSFRAATLSADDDPMDDPLLIEAYSREDEPSHLVSHSDCSGFYVPLDFPRVILADPKYNDELGGMVGSSHRLRAELETVAPALDIRLREGRLEDAEIERLSDLTEDEQGPFREIESWLLLHEAARLSIENEAVIAFL